MLKRKIKKQIRIVEKKNKNLFHRFSDMKTHHQIIFSLIIAFAVISFWRGVWGLWDEYIFPNNYNLSLWISIIVGILILIGTHYTTKELM